MNNQHIALAWRNVPSTISFDDDMEVKGICKVFHSEDHIEATIIDRDKKIYRVCSFKTMEEGMKFCEDEYLAMMERDPQ